MRDKRSFQACLPPAVQGALVSSLFLGFGWIYCESKETAQTAPGLLAKAAEAELRDEIDRCSFSLIDLDVCQCLAFYHPNRITRVHARGKLGELLLPRDAKGAGRGRAAEEEVEHRCRIALREVIACLEAGNRQAAAPKVRLVAFALSDSLDDETVLLAIRAVRLFGDAERRDGIAASHPSSVFSTLLDYGLLDNCYAMSWSSKIREVESLAEPMRAKTKRRIAELSEALCAFGSKAAEVVMERFEKVRTTGEWEGIRSERQQAGTVLRFLGGHSVGVVDRLFQMLRGKNQLKDELDRLFVTSVIADMAPHDPQQVRTLLERYKIDLSNEEFRAIQGALVLSL